MGRNTTERIALTPETKDLLDEQKPVGVTYDHWIRNDPRLSGER
jgi:hypothetical protein